MTTKDEALKMALGALAVATTPLAEDRQRVLEAIAACRAALAQKDEQEPVAVGEIVQRQAMRNVGGADTGLGYSDGYVTDTWKDVEFYPLCLNDKRRFAPKWNESLEVGTKLYTTQPKRQPLTDDEVSELSRTMVKENKSVNWLCRAIEAAHGIGVEHDTP